LIERRFSPPSGTRLFLTGDNPETRRLRLNASSLNPAPNTPRHPTILTHIFPALNHPIFTKLAWRLMPAVSICCFFACFDRYNISLAKFQLRDALTLGDTVDGLGASLFVIAGALTLGGGFVLFPLPFGLRGKEGAA
jgi:hypothetical protein